jgi:AbiV family abortive infection protein
MREQYLRLYRAAFNNAGRLVDDAETLYAAKRFPTAYALAFTALEEIAKSQVAADVFTGLITEEQFNRYYLSHAKKIGSMAWATTEAEHYLDAPEGGYVDVEAPEVAHRLVNHFGRRYHFRSGDADLALRELSTP